MQDAIIKGEGNSRYLKTVGDFLTKYPSYEAFVDALVAGTLPVDFNGINPDGWAQLGTALNKASLLTDATAELVGLGEEATPNEMLSVLATLVNKAKDSADSALDKVNGLVTYGTADKVPGSSSLATGTIYAMYE